MRCRILREEIEKMLKDQLEIKEVVWNKDGSVNVEMDMNEVKKKGCCHPYYTYPIYIEPYKYKPIYWTTSGHSGTTLTYCSPTITTSTGTSSISLK